MNINGHQIRASIGTPVEENQVSEIDSERVFQLVLPVTVNGKLFDPKEFEKKTTINKIVVKLVEEDNKSIGTNKTFTGSQNKPFRSSCSPSRLYDYRNFFITTVNSGDRYNIPSSNLLDQDGNIIKRLYPNENYTITASTITCDYPDYFIRNSNKTLIGSGTTTAGVDVNFELPDIDIYNDLGYIIESDYPSVKDYVIPKFVIYTQDGFSEIFSYSGDVYTQFYSSSTINTRIRNSDGSFDQIFSASTVDLPNINIWNSNSDIIFSGFPSVKDYTISPFNIVDESGYSASSIVYSATVHTNITSNNIIYQRPYINQKISYAIGDLGWHVQNDSFNYSANTLYGIRQELDITLSAGSSWFYTLKHDNVFGNKYRFTNSVGMPSPSGTHDFESVDLNLMTTALFAR
jgi:hypothetical protein